MRRKSLYDQKILPAPAQESAESCLPDEQPSSLTLNTSSEDIHTPTSSANSLVEICISLKVFFIIITLESTFCNFY